MDKEQKKSDKYISESTPHGRIFGTDTICTGIVTDPVPDSEKAIENTMSRLKDYLITKEKL